MTRGANFGSEEVDSLLEIIEEVLPISATQWESVADIHRSRYPDAARTVDSIKRKFKQLHNKKIPTGDPICPPAVRLAKRVRMAIIELMDSSDLNDDDDPPEDERLENLPSNAEESARSSDSDSGDEFSGSINPASVTTRAVMDPASRLAAIVARRGNAAGTRATAARSSNGGVEGDDGEDPGASGDAVDGEQGGGGC